MIYRVHQLLAFFTNRKSTEEECFSFCSHIYVIVCILGSRGQSIHTAFRKAEAPCVKMDTLCPNFAGSASAVNITDILEVSEPSGLQREKVQAEADPLHLTDHVSSVKNTSFVSVCT